MSLQLIMILSIVIVFCILGFMMNRSIKKHESQKANAKKKKGKNRNMPLYKKPGR
jgi:hypothetical protein